MLANNYFCTLNTKIMKGILPTYCRTMGYTLLILCVFLPLMMFMFGMINDSNLLFTKASVKLFIWFSLFMIFVDISKFSTFFSFPRHISRPKVCISHFP